MKYLLPLLFLSVSTAHASSTLYNCNELENPIVKILNLLPGKECPGPEELILKRVEDEYKKYYGDLPQKKQNVKGFQLTGSAKELEIAKDMLGAKPPAEWKIAAQGCTTIMCAFEKLLGTKEAAMQVFNIKAKSGYSMNLDQTINQSFKDQLWSPAEIREIDGMSSKLPPELRSLPKLTELTRMADNLRLHNHSANVAAYAMPKWGSDPAELVAYDAAMEGVTKGKDPLETTSWPQEAIVHELCHHHDYKGYYATNNGTMTSEQRNSQFAKLSGWKEKTGPKGESTWESAAGAKFVSNYAHTAPAEDYAESCMNYVLHPQKLKEASPEKYDFMKKHVFNNKEFNDEVWSSDKVKNWPALNELLADESLCDEKLVECLGDMKQKSWMSFESQIKNNECFKSFKHSRLQEISTRLEADDNYCPNGGQAKIVQQLDKICGSSVKKLTNALESGSKADFKSAAKSCETDNDFTQECVMKAANVEASPLVTKILAAQVPDRMTALGNKLQTLNSTAWLKPCIESASKIQTYLGDGKNVYQFTPKDTSKKAAFVGRFLYQGYDTDDANASCAEAMIESIKTLGIKTPESGSPIDMMKDPFKKELTSFQNEVMDPISKGIKGCLTSNCRTNKIAELVFAWEQKDPEKRNGFSSKEFAEELREKFK